MAKFIRSILLAATLVPGAAEGPVPYYLVFLRPAPDRKALAKADADRIQAAHMANIRATAQRGVLVAAGPFEDKPPAISGIFVFQAESLAEARRIAEQDPTVVEHRNTVDVFAWRGPKGIGEEYVRIHKENPQAPQDMGVHPFYMMFRGKAWDGTDTLRAHHEYVAALQRDGKLAAVGAIEGDPDLRGILIFNRISDEEAQRLMGEDPAVKSGLLRADAHRWWCAAHVLPKSPVQ